MEYFCEQQSVNFFYLQYVSYEYFDLLNRLNILHSVG